MKLRIESTETGEVFNMRMESSIDKLKFQVSLLIPIPPHDQIMLIGPPYKILDSLYGPSLNVEGKRIFVFNRRILSDETKEPQRIKLLPYEVMKPDLTSDLMKDVDTHEMRSALMEFESYFQQQLKKSQCIEAFVQESYKSCKACVAQHQVQLDGIGAAISNLQYFHASISKAYVHCESKLSVQQNEHTALLDSFEASLERLAQVPLHPAIKAAFSEYTAAASLNASSTTAGYAGAAGGAITPTTTTPTTTPPNLNNITINTTNPATTTNTANVNISMAQTLYDCVPVDRERVYLAQCASNHKKVEDNLRRVRLLFAEVQAGVQELALPNVDFDNLQHHLDNIAQENAAQAEVMRRFRRDYQFVYEHITHCTSPSRNSQQQHQPMQGAGGAFDAAGDDASVSSAPPHAPPRQDSPESHHHHTHRDSFATCAGAGGPIDVALMSHSNSTINTANTTTAGTAVPGVAVLPSDDVDSVLVELQRRKNSHKGGHYLELMESRVKRVKESKNEIERSQNWLLRSIYRLMRQIALLQTDIQYKLKRDVEWMKKLNSGHNEYFLHLQNVTKLPIVYHHTLNEIVRRRSYNALFENEVVSASEKISSFRTEETKQREAFMQSYGLHLPSIFFRAIPTLKEKPPYFSPTLTDPQWLPDIHYEDVDRAFLTADFVGNNSTNTNNSVDGGSVGNGPTTVGSAGGFARTVSFGSLAGAAEGNSGKNLNNNNSSSNMNNNYNNDTDTVVTEQSEAVGMLTVVGGSTSQHKDGTEEGGGGDSAMSNVTSYTRTSNISASTNNNINITGNNNAVVGSFPPDYKRPITGGALTLDIGTPITKPTHADTNPHNTTTHNINMGGSVILPAASAAENNNNMANAAYNELLQKYRRMEYENSQLLFKVTEMNKQLQQHGQKGESAPAVTAAPSAAATPTHAQTNTDPTTGTNVGTNTTSNTIIDTSTNTVTTATANITTNTNNEVSDANTATDRATTTDAGTAPITPVATTTSTTATADIPRTPINMPTSTTPSHSHKANTSTKSDEELAAKLSRVGVLNKLLHGYKQLHNVLTSDSLVQLYLSELSAHNPIPIAADSLYTTDETYVDNNGTIRNIKDTTADTLRATSEVMYALHTQLKYPKITFLDFKAGDVALFMPVDTENRKIWMAFHAGTPYRYLAQDSLASFQARSKNKEQRPHIMGRIILIDTKTASLDENPYNLAL
eukprot:gene13316-15338_t